MILILNMNKELVTLSFKIFSTVENQLQISSIMQKNISFQYIFLNKTLNEIENLNPKTLTEAKDLPTKIIKEKKAIISYYIHHNFNNSSPSSTFSTVLDCVDVPPVLKKDNETDKKDMNISVFFQ